MSKINDEIIDKAFETLLEFMIYVKTNPDKWSKLKALDYVQNMIKQTEERLVPEEVSNEI